MIRRGFSLLLLLSLTCSQLAFATTPPDALPPAEVTVSATTPLGFVLIGLVSLGGVALLAVLSTIALFFSRKAGDGVAWGIANRLWLAMQNAVSHAEAELRPQLQKALADGKLTPEEAAELKSRTIAIFKTIAGDLLEQAPKALGIATAGMPSWISGMLERAVSAMKGPKKPEAVPSRAAAAKVVAAARANPPAAVPEPEAPAPAPEPPAVP